MKVQALTDIRYGGKKYAEGETFEHKSPELAIEHGLLKIVESGKEKSKGVVQIETTTE